MGPIAFYDFNSLHNDDFRQKTLKRFDTILSNNSFIEGPWNDSFEKRFAELHQARHCLLTANGTDALEISLKTLGVGQGDLVALPAISFFASAEAVVNIGAIPIFFDVDENTGLGCPQSLDRLLSQHSVKAIMPVHIFGMPAPIEEYEALESTQNIPFIEDAAQAEGTFLKNGPVGSNNNLVTFSFYPTKNLSAMGDAGCILTQDPTLAEQIKTLRNHGRTPEGHTLVGRNSRCDHLQAAVLDLKLDNLEGQNQKRKELAARYINSLQDLPFTIMGQQFSERSSWHLFPIKLGSKEERIKLQNHLKSHHVATAPFYELALPQERPYQHCDGEWDQAAQIAGTTLCLPIHPFMSDEVQDSVVARIRELF